MASNMEKAFTLLPKEQRNTVSGRKAKGLGGLEETKMSDPGFILNKNN
jgi:hypothetical protein